MVAFEVSDLRLDRTASFATLLLSPRQPPRAAASDVDRGVSLVIVTAVALVHKRVADRDARELLGSGDRLTELSVCLSYGLFWHKLTPTIQLPRLVVLTEIFCPNS